MHLNFFKTCLPGLLLVTTAMKKKSNARNNKNKENRALHHHLHPDVNIVGPDCIQVLQGKLYQKDVALVLCGESHFDALDVTRRGGYFHAKEGWVEITATTHPDSEHGVGSDSLSDVAATTACRIVTQSKRHLPLEKAKEWAKAHVKDEEVWGHLVLLWKHTSGETRKQKGKAFLMELESVDKIEMDDDDDHDDEWVCFQDSHAKQEHLPVEVQEWIKSISSSSSTSRISATPYQPPHRVFEWGDLDPEARLLNNRRLNHEQIPERELDATVEKRKEDRKQENIWTWDDWFAYIQKNNNAISSNKQAGVALHLILEATVPPFELDLYRPPIQDLDQLQLPPAAECVRCRSEDEDGYSEYDHDPSSDGVGSYMDFIYRRFMGEMMSSSSDDKNDGGGGDDHGSTTTSTWLHCVDTRDLGCQSACHADCIKEKWHDLLLPQERQRLLDNRNVAKAGGAKFQQLSPDAANDRIQFVPACQMNPEERELQMLQARGALKRNDGDANADDAKDSDDDTKFTFPSFEGFFGQNTDFLYYSPQVKLSYSAFLANCVGSLTSWEKFFTHLFLGGTIPDALAVLSLGDDEKRASVHVRSPVLKVWNAEESCFDYKRRDDKEHYITYPFFPYIFHLVAKDSSLQRTWSSQLFVTLQEKEQQAATASANHISGVAAEAKKWFLETVRRHSDDPKGSDDVHGGGEWFEAFLRAAHRDIYDDIDVSDPTVLLRKNYMPSEESSGLKHNIGKIKIPSCSAGFDEITETFRTAASDTAGKVITDRVEVMASILIDIWMSSLIDFSTVLKVAKVVNDDDSSRVVIVCYMGSIHTRAVGDFYFKCMGFKKKAFIGKLYWDEDEPQLLSLPPTLWNVSDLFARYS